MFEAVIGPRTDMHRLTAEGGGLLGPRQLDAAQTPLSAAANEAVQGGTATHSCMIDPESTREGGSLLLFPFCLQRRASTWESISRTTRPQTR
jgi:hypothetical protein